jgi:hypothetical protein
MICWYCRTAPADSREHKHKKSDVKRSSDDWSKANLPFLVRNGKMKEIQGPDSKSLKFLPSLCRYCNSTRSQPFDKAYEAFSSWVNAKGDALMAASHLDFGSIYGDGFSTGILNLLKYFLKHMGCHLANDGYEVPLELSRLLDSDNIDSFSVTLSRNTRLDEKIHARGPGILFNFPMYARTSQVTHQAEPPLISGLVVGFLDVVYRWGNTERYSWEGDSASPSSRLVRLGLYEGGIHIANDQLPGYIKLDGKLFRIPNLSPQQRATVLTLCPEDNVGVDDVCAMAHSILSPSHPDLTKVFLKKHLTVEQIDTLFRAVFPSCLEELT